MNLVLQSERLLLRPLAETDLDMELELLTDHAVTRYVCEDVTAEQVHQWLPVMTRRCAGGSIGIWCIVDQAADEKLGHAVLLPMPIDATDTDWRLVQGDQVPDGEIEVGYLFKQTAWGKGYATETCKRLLKFGFEDAHLDEIVAVTHPDNAASQNVLRKCGMIDEGMRRAYASQCPGFRLTRKQWLEANAVTP